MTSFRTIEVSNPRFEHDGLRFVTVKSPALGTRADITLYIPPGLAEPDGAGDANVPANIPVVLLLHGVYGSHWAWTHSGGVHHTAQRLIEAGEIAPMILAMPSDGLWGDGSGYVKHSLKDFEQWIVDEVPAALAQAVPQVVSQIEPIVTTPANQSTPGSTATRILANPLFICGLSMGGFGALRLGAKFAPRFQGISGHSSITHFRQMEQFVEEELSTFGVAPEDESVLETMLAQQNKLPPLRFDCGTSDPLIEHNRELHQQLRAAGVQHIYEEFRGGHEWSYWEEHVADSLRFFHRILTGATL